MADFWQLDWSLHNQTVDLATYNEYLKKTNKKPDFNLSKSVLKDLINDCKDFGIKKYCFHEIDENNLLKFLHVSKSDPQRAFDLLRNWLIYKNKYPEIFNNSFDTKNQQILRALKDGLPSVLENSDRKGRAVLILNANNWHNEYSLTAIYQSLLLTITRLTNETKYLINGFVIIVDWTGFTLRQCKQINPKLLKVMLEGLQNYFPAKFKACHFIEQPWFVQMSLAVVRPFLSEKASNRLFIHGNNLSTLHDFIPKDILPTELGGDISTVNTGIWIEKLLTEKTCIL